MTDATEISRRSLIAAATGGAAALLGGPLLEDAGARHRERNRASTAIPWSGAHQAGVTTPQQTHLALAALDVVSGGRAELIGVLRAWQAAIEHLTVGAQVPGGGGPTEVPVDTGEAVGQGPARLTVTIGFGPSLFDGRFGLAADRPPALAALPAFAGDALEDARSGGDLLVQACADSRLVAEHAVRMLARIGTPATRIRWVQSGFGEGPAQPGQGSGRNLFGFKDGTSNLRGSDEARMQRNVWAAPDDGAPWMAGGTYLVYRRVRMLLEDWDASPLDEQEQSIGRRKASGAPFGGTGERDRVDPRRLPIASHVRLSNPRTGQASEDERILRRGYSFHDGIDPATGLADAGLAFIAYQRDPRRQFVPIQRRLAASDLLNEYLVHTGSAIAAVPPGVHPGGFPGDTLLGGVAPMRASAPQDQRPHRHPRPPAERD